MTRPLAIALLLTAACTARAQTLVPPTLLCAENGLGGDVTLTWTVPSNPCGPFQGYEVWASMNPAGPYTLLATVGTEATTSWTHVGADGLTDTWYYYLVPDYACPGFGAPTSDTLDNRDPQPPVIDFITVTPAGAELHWLPSPSPETTAYIIYRQTPGFTPIDTVYGRLNTVYTDAGAATASQPESYSIAALDSCRTVGLFANPAHVTVYLEGDLDRCGDWRLDWTPYGEWPGGVTGHEIWTSVNGAPPAAVASLPAAQLAYTLPVNDGDSVCVTVRALRGDGVHSASNERCRRVNKVQPSAFVAWANATMLTDDSARLSWYPDPAADATDFRLEAGPNPGPWTVEASGAVAGAAPDAALDAPAPAGRFYRVGITDSCGVTAFTAEARTMRLRGEAGFDLTNRLSWNPLVLPGATVTGHGVERRTLDGPWAPLVDLGPSAEGHEDEVSAFLDGDGVFCYRVSAYFRLDVPELGLSLVDTSRSNGVCVEQAGKVFTPNAVIPGAGPGAAFRPVVLFAEDGSYTLEILNRYGEVIFATADPDAAWDGTLDGEAVPGGSYLYIVRFRARNGRDIVQRGTVTVVR